jgi:hypothetical protein
VVHDASAPETNRPTALLAGGRLHLMAACVEAFFSIEPVTAGASSFREAQGTSKELFVGLSDDWLERYVGIEQYQSTSCTDMCFLVGNRVY